MHAKRFAFAACLVALLAVPLWADEAPQAKGDWSMSGKPLKLHYAAAFDSTYRGDPSITVVASSLPINLAEIKKSLDEKKPHEVWLRQPHVKVEFDRAGKAATYYATAGGFTTNGNKALTGEIKREGGRVTGKAVLESQGEGTLQRSFDFEFATGLIGSSDEPAQQTLPLAKLGASGTFKGNGKEAKLAFVSARPGEPFDDKPSIVLVFTERDHSADPKPSFNAAFGRYGSALIVSCHEDGDIFSCEVAHAAHSRKPFSTSGTVSIGEFQLAGGQVQGQISSGGEQEFFDQTWEIDIKFAAAYQGAAKNPQTPAPSPRTAAQPRERPQRETPATGPAEPAGEKLNVKDLAILEGASNVEYKKIVEHLSFTSESDYRTLAADLARKLDAQGWTKDGNDLVGVSAILKRKRGSASLTIFVKPADTGSTVTVMSKGLSWE